MSGSPISSKSIIFLLGLLYLQAQSVGATISTSAGFPQDVFAKPAFQVNLGRLDKGSNTLPVKRSDVISILEQQVASSASSSEGNQAFAPTPSDVAALAVPGSSYQHDSGSSADSSRVLIWSLQRSSADDLQLCSIPDFTYKPESKPASNYRSNNAGTPRTRQDLVRDAQRLLEPLKRKCLYHTFDWFTYSFCYGREIRQFRRLEPQIAAQKAFKAAGGGEAGEKAAVEAAQKINDVSHPIADPAFPAFVLGRWTPRNEGIVGDDRSHRHQQQPLHGDAVQSATDVASFNSARDVPAPGGEAGLDLVEEVQFGDWDEEELFAAEAKALAQFEGTQNDIVEASPHVSGSPGHESQRHRYLTQTWGNGTMCDMNHQPRTVEVQFHCSNRQPAEDRIVLFKETTICNYVLIVETPRLCADSAFGSEKEEPPLPIQCHKVVDDDFLGPTLGDPDRVTAKPLDQLHGNEQNVEQQESTGSRTEDDTQASSTAQEGAEEASTTSHTYGDLSRYGSVYDDYFDEALGGHGALYEQHDHEHDHDDHDGHEHADTSEEAEVLVEIGIDEEGKPFVNKIVQSPSSNEDSTAKEPSRKENGKRRNDDETQADKIEIDIDDFLSVLRGDEGSSLEKKIADQIAQVLNKQKESSVSPGDKEDAARQKKETPNDVADLYKKLLGAFNGGIPQQGAKEAKFGKAGQQKSPPQMRMEKVGDSLSERAKRFYDAQARGEGEQKTKQANNEAPPIEEHLEL